MTLEYLLRSYFTNEYFNDILHGVNFPAIDDQGNRGRWTGGLTQLGSGDLGVYSPYILIRVQSITPIEYQGVAAFNFIIEVSDEVGLAPYIADRLAVSLDMDDRLYKWKKWPTATYSGDVKTDAYYYSKYRIEFTLVLYRQFTFPQTPTAAHLIFVPEGYVGNIPETLTDRITFLGNDGDFAHPV